MLIDQLIRLCVIGIGFGGALSPTWGMEASQFPVIPSSSLNTTQAHQYREAVKNFLGNNLSDFLKFIQKTTIDEIKKTNELKELSTQYQSWLASKQQALQKQLEGSVLANNKAAYATS